MNHYVRNRQVSIHARSFERAIHLGPRDHLLGQYVSIHARSFERAIRTSARTSGVITASFNPRPLIRAGDTRDLDRLQACFEVSIHARSFERAIRRSRLVHLAVSGFNPRPLIRAGDTSAVPS